MPKSTKQNFSNAGGAGRRKRIDNIVQGAVKGKSKAKTMPKKGPPPKAKTMPKKVKTKALTNKEMLARMKARRKSK